MKDGRLKTNDGADMKGEIQHDGATEEAVKQATLMSCERTTAKDNADKLRAVLGKVCSPYRKFSCFS